SSSDSDWFLYHSSVVKVPNLENGAKITDALTSLLRHRRSSTTPYSCYYRSVLRPGCVLVLSSTAG
ncbi:MAG TPA: hypothetical protein PJ988_18705, partial [Anaerolinea sp.]|nr:hypothetical protein [Anaerolinea sp.]